MSLFESYTTSETFDIISFISLSGITPAGETPEKSTVSDIETVSDPIYRISFPYKEAKILSISASSLFSKNASGIPEETK